MTDIVSRRMIDLSVKDVLGPSLSLFIVVDFLADISGLQIIMREHTMAFGAVLARMALYLGACFR